MSTPSPYEPHPQENLPAAPAHESARTDGAGSDKLAGKPSTHLTATPVAKTAGNQSWSSYPELHESDLRRHRRRVVLPIVLFVATCLSTFWVGAANWRPQAV